MRYLLIALLVSIDQITKYLAVSNIKGKAAIEIIPQVFQLNYVENTGAAFGVMRDSQWFFIIVTLVLICYSAYYYEKKLKMANSKIYGIIYTLIMAGAIGNLIDRIFNGYVVDMFDLYVINYPVFNVADICVCVGCVLLGVVIMRSEKKEK